MPQDSFVFPQKIIGCHDNKTGPWGRAVPQSSKDTFVHQRFGHKMLPHKIVGLAFRQGLYGTVQIIDYFKSDLIAVPALVPSVYIGHKMATAAKSTYGNLGIF